MACGLAWGARGGWVLLGATLAVGAGASCAEGTGHQVGMAHDHRVPREPTMLPDGTRPLAAMTGSMAAPATGTSRATDVIVAARLLVITADGQDAAFGAITSTLDYLGTPYDVLNATTGPALTPDVLATGDLGKYYGIILDLGDLVSGGQSAFTAEEWLTLATYEARFGARRAALYIYPSASYGLTAAGGGDLVANPVSARCTQAAAQVFTGLNCAVPLAINSGWGYPGRATDAATTPLLVDDGGNVYAAIRSYSDGREALALTFSQTSFHLPTLALAYGVVNWVTRGVFVGERHVYLSAQIDDLFLASDIYTGGVYRITDGDLQTLADWQSRWRARPVAADLRLVWAFNGQGSATLPEDPLTEKAVALGSTFSWVNHTWDHYDLTSMEYAEAFQEFSLNSQFVSTLGLTPHQAVSAVTPAITGLRNRAAMQAAYDAGVRYVVGDTSQPGGANPSPNAGMFNSMVPEILEIPRRPNELYFDVSQPAEWEAEYAALVQPRSYGNIVEEQSEVLLRYLLRGENDPWMFHQANARDYGGGHSLLADLLDATLTKYAALATLPVVSPTMDELAQRVRDRMSLNTSGVSAALHPGGRITIRTTHAATVPVTGLCTPAAEHYAGQRISYLKLEAGESVTLSLEGCNEAARTDR